MGHPSRLRARGLLAPVLLSLLVVSSPASPADAPAPARVFDAALARPHARAGVRDPEDLEQLLHRAVLAALAAFESDLIGERTKMALHHKRTIGERFSRHAPYGSTFDTAGRLKPNESERRNVRVMQQLAGRGLSQKKIADRLPKLGIVNRSGRPFHPSQVGVFLRRERQHARVALEERFAVTD